MENYSFGFEFYDSAFSLNPPYYGFYSVGSYSSADLIFTITDTTDVISAATFKTTGSTSPYITEALIKSPCGGPSGALRQAIQSDTPRVAVPSSTPLPSSAAGLLALFGGLDCGSSFNPGNWPDL